jgi:serine/threonine-protein kinase HipA
MNINRCPGCFEPDNNTYCKKCLKKLFNGKKVSHILNFDRPEFDRINKEQSGRLSLSGIQIKHSLKLENNNLILTENKGEYILKPIPSGQFYNLDQLPANEHLTMQIASRVYKINTAANAIIFFSDGEIAYITKRFDILPNGNKLLQEDFAQISERTEETHGKNYKYDFSYEEIAALIKKYVKAYSVEIESYFRIILFNYLFSNGDAHLKNFSLYRNDTYGDYMLTPYYDLLNTSLHVPGEKDMALELFKDGFETEQFRSGSKYTKPDFTEFADRIGINKIRFNKIYNNMLNGSSEVENLVSQSFLKDSLQTQYLNNYFQRLDRLKS